MKKYFLTYFLFLFVTCSFAQTFDYGNGWYQADVNRPFIKIVVPQTGIQRLSKNDFLAAGHSVISSVDARNFRLYFRGNEVPIFVYSLNAAGGPDFEFIEFFGKKNDGRVDSTMYRDGSTGMHDSDAIPNIEVSLFSDSAAYFLTWVGGTGFPLRISSAPFSNQYDVNNLETSFLGESKFEFLPNGANTAYITGGGGSTNVEHALNSDYTDGEGYQSKTMFNNESPYINSNFKTPGFVSNQLTTPSFKARIFGRSSIGHHLQLFINNNQIFDTTISSVNNSAYNVYEKTFTKPINFTLTNTTAVKIATGGTYGTDNNHVSWYSLEYWRDFQFNGEKSVKLLKWKVDQSGQPKRYLKFDNIHADTGMLIYTLNYDNLNPMYRIRGTVAVNGTGKSGKIVMPTTIGIATDLWMATDSAILKPVIKPNHALSNLHNEQGAKFVIITHRSLEQSANAYKTYRDTCTINQIATKVVFTDQIYDEYSYGTITPLAIQRFCKDALDNWQIKPEYFMIWGKGSFMTRYTINANTGAIVPNKTLVPAMGYPASDYDYISHYDPNEFKVTPQAAIGRVCIYSNAEGLDYLAKINDYEHKSWNVWMKKGIFLGGGEDESEQSEIFNTLKFCRDIYSSPYFAGDTIVYQKNSTATFDNNADYHSSISEGVSLIHFFGHSTSNISDIRLNSANEYTNYGKYPIIIAMGCYGGDFTGTEYSFGEYWVLNKERGALAYIANSTEGFLAPLKPYAKDLYPKMYGSMLGQRIGDILKSHLTDYMNQYAGSAGVGSSIMNRNNGRQMNLQGDPTFKIKAPTKPDFDIKAQDVSYEPEILTSFVDSFNLRFTFRNLGYVTPTDTFDITIRQQLPDGTWYNHPTIQRTINQYQASVEVKLVNPAGKAMTGPNSFEIFIDPNNKIDEYENYANNKVVNNTIVAGNVPAPLFPIKYAVVPNNQISLIASSFSITRDSSVKYVFEIDTVYDFVSPFVKSQEIVGKSNFAEWVLPFTLQDSQVYYWRVRLADVQPSTWAYSTFRYIQGKEGWAQAKIPQFTEDKLNQIELDVPHNEWDFTTVGQKFTLKVGAGSNATGSGEGNVVLNKNDQLAGINYAVGTGYMLVVIDAKTLEFKTNPWFIYQYNASWTNGPSLQAKLRQDLASIQNGDYFFLCSVIYPRLDLFDSQTFDYLEQLGVNTLRTLPPLTDFAIFGRKGFPNETIENYTPKVGTFPPIIEIEKRLFKPNDRGDITSVRIGPSKGWQQLIWDWKTKDAVNNERVQVEVHGVKYNGTDDVLQTITATGTHDLTSISYTDYPFLYLKATAVDSFNLTAPQLNNWHVLYSPVPDAIIDPFIDFSFQSETLLEGQDLYIKVGAKNPTPVDMDSLLVGFSIRREDGSEINFPNQRYGELLSKGRITIPKTIGNTQSLNLAGNCRLRVELNPNYDQPEQYSFNNIYIQPFKLADDNKNPLLDVTFDGKHILDDDIVSPTPEILVELKDDNQYLALDDSSTFELWFQDAREVNATYKKIEMTDPRVKFIKGSLPNNKAKLIFKPGVVTPLDDAGGDFYKIKVRGKDKRDNYSGANNSFYEVNFKVIKDRTLTNVLNYPNPFSTSTRFVYILTGDELPTVFQIHIYTVTGKLVKVIDLAASGDIHFGKNISDYSWDGTDEYGDKLANGVYLYRTIIKTPNDDLKSSDLDNKTDKMFKQGWGKMYLMR